MIEAQEHYNGLKDKLEVLKVAENMIPAIQEQMGADMDMEAGNEEMGLMDENVNGGFGAINIRQVAGVVDQIDLPRLRRLIFRGTKGKSYMYVQTIEK